MTVYAKMKTVSVAFEPTTPAAQPINSIFVDSTNSNVFSNKTTGGTTSPIGSTSSADYLVKYKRNSSGSFIPAYRRVALMPDGSVALADSDNPSLMKDIGMSIEGINDGVYGRIILNGANAAGALTGLGFLSGQNIFLGKTPGTLVNSTSGFDPNTDTIMRVGVADCATNTVGSAATDLIMTIEVYSSPGGA